MAESPVLFVYYRPDNDDAYPGVPARHITEADWARFSPSQRRTVEGATTQEGYTRRKVWLHRDLVDETEQERAEREAAEQAAREAFDRAQRNVKGWEYDTIASELPDTIAGIVSTNPAITTAVTAAVGAKIPADPYDTLDIWPEFNANGGTGSWSALTYADYMAGVDDSLQGAISSGTVVKTDLGASSGPEHIYSYAAGNGPINVLIVAGQHGNETLGIWGAMRWFESFVSSNEPVMRQMRNAFRVTWIPVLNASKYRSSRINTNGVDTNRNFDLLWTRYTDANPEYFKGTAPFSEPETQAVKTLMDAGNFRHVFDCHNYSEAGDTAKFVLPGHWFLGSRQLNLDAIAAWHRLYGTGIAWDQLNPKDTFPMLVNYANYHMRHLNGKADSTAVTLEASANLRGSVTTQHATRDAIRAYAGMIHTHLMAVMSNGFRATAIPYTHARNGWRSAQQNTITIGDGGTLIDQTTFAPLRFSEMVSNGTQNTKDYMEVPLVCAPALLTVEVNGMLRSLGNPVGRHELTIEIDGTTASNEKSTCTVTATSGETATYGMKAVRYYNALDANTVPIVRVPVRRINGGNAELLTMNMVVTVTPHVEGHLVPRMDGA